MLLDIGIGIFASIFVANAFSLPLSGVLVFLGIAFALLPDLDFIYSVAKHWPKDERSVIKHRSLIHYPLIYIPAGSVIALFFGMPWAVLFFLASLGHFIHDSIGLGWGVAWLWPLRRESYTFFWRYTAPEKILPRKIVYRWEQERIDDLITEYTDHDWLRNLYLKFHPFFVTEIAVFLLALFVLWRLI
jgi:hypothetical protein